MERLPPWVNRYIGIPFLENGRSMKGIDCWGLVWLILKEEAGIEVPSFNEMYSEGDTGRWKEVAKTVGAIVNGRKKEFERVVLGQEKLFDGVVLRLYNNPLHVGLVLEPGLMIHSVSSEAASVIQRYDGLAWKKRVLGIHRATKAAHA